jgi:hypothetical protein
VPAGLLEDVWASGRASWAWAGLEPANVSITTLTAATTHSAMATAAVTVPGLAPMLSQFTFLVACEILANHVGTARRAIWRRSSTAFSVVEEQRLRT